MLAGIERKVFLVAHTKIWVFTSDEGIEVKGKSTPYLQHGGSLGRRWDEGIGLPILKSGVYNLKVMFNSDLSELSHLNPQIKISPGGVGVKNFASPLQSYFPF